MSENREITVHSRFNGPPTSGNGGWTAGLMADALAGGPEGGTRVVEVSLRQPPPLETPLVITPSPSTSSAASKSEPTGSGPANSELAGSALAGKAIDASSDTGVVATARAVSRTLKEVAGVPHEIARSAMAAYPGLTFHPFATCFACGTERDDGLGIWPGRVSADDTRVASIWVPDASLASDDDAGVVSVPATWAALDCIGGWAGDLTERLMVLGRMTTQLHRRPTVDEEHVVVGEPQGHEGRKTFTAATLYDFSGRVVATAEHIWIAVDPEAFGGQRPTS